MNRLRGGFSIAIRALPLDESCPAELYSFFCETVGRSMRERTKLYLLYHSDGKINFSIVQSDWVAGPLVT